MEHLRDKLEGGKKTTQKNNHKKPDNLNFSILKTSAPDTSGKLDKALQPFQSEDTPAFFHIYFR